MSTAINKGTHVYPNFRMFNIILYQLSHPQLFSENSGHVCDVYYREFSGTPNHAIAAFQPGNTN